MATKAQDAAGRTARATSAEIRAEMARQRMSQVTLAERIDKSQNYLSKRLRDEVSLTINDMESIASALGIPYATLVERTMRRIRNDEGQA